MTYAMTSFIQTNKRTEKSFTVLIFDSQEISLTGLCTIFKSYKGAAITGNIIGYSDIVAIAKETNPAIIVADISTEKAEETIAALLEIKNSMPHVEIMTLMSFFEESVVIRMLEFGIKGCLLKSSKKEEFIAALDELKMHQTYLCSTTSKNLFASVKESVTNYSVQEKREQFSTREIHIIILICKEFGNKEIADKLNLSVRTVEGYREKILEKIKARNTAGIVVYAIKNGYYVP
jgi:DNA-binding NarL/FixJ family response regulator